MTEHPCRCHPRPDPQPPAGTLPPRRRAGDQIQHAAIVAAWDAAVDAGHLVSFALADLLCRRYHEEMQARGGR